MPLDFARSGALFMGTEQELALALGIGIGDLRHFRANPQRVSPELAARLGHVLIERGQGMARVGEMLVEQAREAGGASSSGRSRGASGGRTDDATGGGDRAADRERED